MSARLDSSLRMTTGSLNALGFVRRHVEIAAPPPPLLLRPSVFAETVKEMYDKILESVNTKGAMAPNAWTWSMVENCKNKEDIKLLFDVLQNLHRFEVPEACVRARAFDFGKKALWEHNVYGLTPTIGSANHPLQYAKEQKDATLMQEVMKLLKKNNLPPQPSTADIVFSICDDTDNWGLLTKYSKRFVRNGVNLHKAVFDIWMDNLSGL